MQLLYCICNNYTFDIKSVTFPFQQCKPECKPRRYSVYKKWHGFFQILRYITVLQKFKDFIFKNFQIKWIVYKNCCSNERCFPSAGPLLLFKNLSVPWPFKNFKIGEEFNIFCFNFLIACGLKNVPVIENVLKWFVCSY